MIKEYRQAKGLTQMALSEAIGVSYQQIQKYEKSGDTISAARLKQLAEALGVPTAVFFASVGEGDRVAETAASYGKMSDDERQLLQLYRSIKDKRTKKAVLEFIKAIASRPGTPQG